MLLLKIWTVFYGVALLPFGFYTTPTNWKMCCDYECEEPISYAETGSKSAHPEIKEYLSFSENTRLTIFAKHIGGDIDIWEAELHGERGLIKASDVKETLIHCSNPQHRVIMNPMATTDQSTDIMKMISLSGSEDWDNEDDEEELIGEVDHVDSLVEEITSHAESLSDIEPKFYRDPANSTLNSSGGTQPDSSTYLAAGTMHTQRVLNSDQSDSVNPHSIPISPEAHGGFFTSQFQFNFGTLFDALPPNIETQSNADSRKSRSDSYTHQSETMATLFSKSKDFAASIPDSGLNDSSKLNPGSDCSMNLQSHCNINHPKDYLDIQNNTNTSDGFSAEQNKTSNPDSSISEMKLPSINDERILQEGDNPQPSQVKILLYLMELCASLLPPLFEVSISCNAVLVAIIAINIAVILALCLCYYKTRKNASKVLLQLKADLLSFKINSDTCISKLSNEKHWMLKKIEELELYLNRAQEQVITEKQGNWYLINARDTLKQENQFLSQQLFALQQEHNQTNLNSKKIMNELQQTKSKLNTVMQEKAQLDLKVTQLSSQLEKLRKGNVVPSDHPVSAEKLEKERRELRMLCEHIENIEGQLMQSVLTNKEWAEETLYQIRKCGNDLMVVNKETTPPNKRSECPPSHPAPLNSSKFFHHPPPPPVKRSFCGPPPLAFRPRPNLPPPLFHPYPPPPPRNYGLPPLLY